MNPLKTADSFEDTDAREDGKKEEEEEKDSSFVGNSNTHIINNEEVKGISVGQLEEGD